MRKQITRVGVVASRSASRLYDEKLKPFADDIKQQEAKKYLHQQSCCAHLRTYFTCLVVSLKSS